MLTTVAQFLIDTLASFVRSFSSWGVIGLFILFRFFFDRLVNFIKQFFR